MSAAQYEVIWHLCCPSIVPFEVNMQKNLSSNSNLRLAELVSALSLASDLGMGQPMEYALRSCVLAVRLGESLGFSESDLRGAYYQALLRYIGCNAETYMLAAIVGDELALRTDLAGLYNGHTYEILGLMMRSIQQANEGTSPLHLAQMVAQGFLAWPQKKETSVGHCQVASRLAARLGFEEPIQHALIQSYERWDGRGIPGAFKREDIVPAVRVVALAQDVIIFHRIGGFDAAVAMAQERKGTAYDPRMVECFCRQAAHLLTEIEEEPTWEVVLDLEPGAHPFLSETQFDEACSALADFADVKSPYTLGHSRGVAELAASAAQRCGLPETDVVAIRRAGLLHDIGRVGVSTGIWVKPGPLSEREWERVRMHPYYTERVLARPPVLARLGALASFHHERLDGSGYHRGVPASMLSPAARILAAADVYHAMIEPRPHRPARTPEEAAEELRREVHAGRLDGAVVNGVLVAAGHHVRSTRRALVAGLSEREVEILRLIARGHSKKQIGELLTISQKTVDHHIQHIYNKINVSTRAAATLFAIEHDLLTDVE
jgi:HD-GYP domain-containing protein (c-di-GMP phosphodiesterase class II)